MGRRRTPELYRAPFPLYALRVDPSAGLLIAAGGGGAAKTGIKNGVHFLQLEQINGRLSASLLHSHDTETRATMNLALAGNILAAGQDAHCQLLRFQIHQQKGKNKAEKAGSKEQGPRQRKGAAPAEKKSGAETHQEGVEFSVENLHEVQTDFSRDPLQKVVCFNHDNTLLATGGTDGCVRVWKVPTLEKVLEFKAHEGEIEDLALGPDGKLVTVGWDLKASVWQKDQLVTQLHWQENGPTFSNTPYRYQACRFGQVPDQPAGLRLFTVQIPHKRLRQPPPCYLTAWDASTFLPLRTRPCGHEVISCLSVRYETVVAWLGMRVPGAARGDMLPTSLETVAAAQDSRTVSTRTGAWTPLLTPPGSTAEVATDKTDGQCLPFPFKAWLWPCATLSPGNLVFIICGSAQDSGI
ncbi:hypothetical protein MG293_003819 [Ovis ammon polii]|uniref:Prolactin regulatory element-binding protein n=1 Tax=Ovis ammon polii TaxID=230172 RepID=A0AAD4UNU3_OVIAM|nr:hypothetical protein MG293_003819 [Ovis ammon polii]